MKKILVFLMIGVVLIAGGCSCDKKEDKNKDKDNKEPEVTVNTADDVVKDQQFEGLQFANTSLTIVDGSSTLVTEVTNNTAANYELNQFIITAKDSDGTVLVTIPGYVGDVIVVGETRTIQSTIDVDLTNATSIEYSVEK